MGKLYCVVDFGLCLENAPLPKAQQGFSWHTGGTFGGKKQPFLTRGSSKILKIKSLKS
jgi:hypothetical protein